MAKKQEIVKKPEISQFFSQKELSILREHGYKIQPKADARRWQQAAAAYKTSGLWNDNGFCCEMANDCDRAFKVKNSGLTITAGRRGTIGDYLAAYDLLYQGHPLRVCVVSLDSGSNVTKFEDHWEEANHLLTCRFDRTWQHWRYTIKLMNLVFFGEHDIDIDSAFLPRKLFTHIRAIKCNAGRKWNQPGKMFLNCIRHLEAELKALEPTLIIAQGYSLNMNPEHPAVTWSVLKAMGRVTGNQGSDAYAQVMSKPQQRRMVVRKWEAPWGQTIMIGSYHPGAMGWYTSAEYGALRNELIPAVQRLRESAFIVR
jgi:hypothetical protein